MNKDKTEKAAQFITKLLRLTQEGRIDWAAVGSPRNDGRMAFETEVEGKRLRIYRYHEEVEAYPLGPIRGREGTRLEVLDGGLVSFTFDGLSGLRNLYDMVAYSISKVDAFMDAVLEKT